MDLSSITSVEALEATVGKRRRMVMMKSIDTLDEGCRIVLAHSPVAAFGYRGPNGAPVTTFVGGAPGFVRIESPQRISFVAEEAAELLPGGVSMLFLLPGIGETLRLNGSVASAATPDGRLTVELQEAFVHCAKCIRRSRLWDGAPAAPPVDGRRARVGLQTPEVVAFLARSPFAALSSWDADGNGDTSPRGDHPGFIHVLDDATLALPDRKGNLRTDTFHNLLTCDELSVAALVPGHVDVLHIDGRASVTNDPTLCSRVSGGDAVPKAALVIRVERVRFRPNRAVEESRLWDPEAQVDVSEIPDMLGMAAQHLAQRNAGESRLSMMRLAGKGFSAAPKVVRRIGEAEYARDLESEGF